MLIFCDNYFPIKTVLYLLNHNPELTTIVITGNSDLFKFYRLLNDGSLTLIHIDPYHPRRVRANGWHKVWYAITDILAERAYLRHMYKAYFAALRNTEVYFFSRGYNNYLFYFLPRLSRYNHLTYISHEPPNVPPLAQNKPCHLTEWLKFVMTRLIYGHSIVWARMPTNNEGIAMLSPTFMRDKVTTVGWDSRAKMTDGFSLANYHVFDASKYDVLYFDDNILDAGYVDRKILQQKLAAIFDVLLRYFPAGKIARKYHPNSPGDKSIIPIGDIIPDFIPAEFLANEHTKIYCTIASTSVVTFPKRLVISFLDLIPLKNSQLTEDSKLVLQSMGKANIVYPQSLEELVSILRDNGFAPIVRA